MKRPRICAALVSNDLAAIKAVESFADLFEVRIDLIGDDWQELVKHLEKPWIACNRLPDEGGMWKGSEAGRIEELVKATERGASIIDIELATKNLSEVLPPFKKRAKCLLSFHELKGTPPPEELKEIVQRQLQAGADICKVITTARKFEDNLTALQLIADFPKIRIISFAMGPLGFTSRVLCPLVGGEFTYAAIEKGRESAPGQLTVSDLTKIYEMM